MGAPEHVMSGWRSESSHNTCVGAALGILILGLTACGGGSDAESSAVAPQQSNKTATERSAQALGATQTVEWTKLADQDAAFQILETRIVRFGVGEKWTRKKLSGLMTCDLATFGIDPAPGVAKTCEVKAAVAGQSLALLAWTPSSDPAVVGYRVYYGTTPRSYDQTLGSGFLAGNVPKFSFTALPAGSTYYFAVTAIDATGRESAYSNEASKKVDPI